MKPAMAAASKASTNAISASKPTTPFRAAGFQNAEPAALLYFRAFGERKRIVFGLFALNLLRQTVDA